MFQPNVVTDNAGLIRLMHSADNGPDGKPRNRSVHSDKLAAALWVPDPCCEESAPVEPTGRCDNCGEYPNLPGRHLCIFHMMHNRYEDRTQWMVRVKEGTPGAEEVATGMWMLNIWLDVEGPILEEVTWSVRKEQIIHGAEMTEDEQDAMLKGTLR
ncbi:MAG TPA: hypothetical protein VM537_07410 [Anaerolineae bacterium]|nr:hypothetical protein [Anaerolineae bacterium]